MIPVSATAVLPTTSNIRRRQEQEDIHISSNECEPDVVTRPVSENINNPIATAKRRTATGTTARALNQCQEELQQYRKMLEKRHEKQDDIQMQILETYKEIKDRNEKFMNAMENYREKTIQQRQRRNELLEEKNNILKNFIHSLKNFQPQP